MGPGQQSPSRLETLVATFAASNLADRRGVVALWTGPERRRYRNCEARIGIRNGVKNLLQAHQVPTFGMLCHGSAGGSAPPLLSSSTEMPSGDFTKAMRPSRGGRWMVTPCSINLAQNS